MNRHLGTVGPFEVRGGLAAGVARYKELSVSLKEDYGIPNISGFIPIGLGSLIFRSDGRDYRLSVMPANSKIKYVVNFSMAFDF